MPSFTSKPRSPHTSSSRSCTLSPGDGFSTQDIAAVVNQHQPTITTRQATTETTNAPLAASSSSAVSHHPPPPPYSLHWTPPRPYDKRPIGLLSQGPQYTTFSGRLVNIYDLPTESKRPNAAKGCLKLMLKDETGTVTVRLWYAAVEYRTALRLGVYVQVWCPHLSRTSAMATCRQNASLGRGQGLFTSVFPERDRSCWVWIHEQAIEAEAREDVHLRRGKLMKSPVSPLPTLMSLQDFIGGGFEVDEVKLLVCVRSVSSKKQFFNKAGASREIVRTTVFDDTAETSLALWGLVGHSAVGWQPSKTVLLLENPGWKNDGASGSLSVLANTSIDVDPAIEETEWLREFARRAALMDHVNPQFPQDFDYDEAENVIVRALFKLSDLDEL